jgi:hypothetical protein
VPERPRDDNCGVRRRALLAALLLPLVVACGAFTAPKPTAGDHTDIVASLVLRGMTVTNQVSGDPGCPGSPLYPNAVRYDVQPAGDPNSYSVYVFGWKSQQTFETDKPTFDACVQGHADANPGPVATSEHLPWRAYGIGWPASLVSAVDAALSGAGGQPAPVQPE